MSNLGPYQDIVTSAKEAGGVDALIRELEARAVAKAAPKLIGVTAVTTLATTGALALAVRQRWLERRTAKEQAQEQVREELRRKIRQESAVATADTRTDCHEAPCARCGEPAHGARDCTRAPGAE